MRQQLWAFLLKN